MKVQQIKLDNIKKHYAAASNRTVVTAEEVFNQLECNVTHTAIVFGVSNVTLRKMRDSESLSDLILHKSSVYKRMSQ